MIPVSTVILLLIISAIAQLIALLIYKLISLFMVQKMALRFQEEKIDSLFNQIRKIIVNYAKERG